MLRSEETAGVASIIELASSAGWAGPPLHRHDFDEAFSVTQGEPTFQLEEEVFARGPGGGRSDAPDCRSGRRTAAAHNLRR